MTLAALAGVGAGIGGVAIGGDAPVDFWLTVLHNNDGESQLVDAGPGLAEFGGIARFAALEDALRAQAATFPAGGTGRGVVTISSGDNFLAGPEFQASLDNGVPFYDSIALSLIGYDAMAIGNHEFDFGPSVLADFINGFTTGVPFLSANLSFAGEPALAGLETSGRIAASTLLTVDGRKVGIVGATTTSLASISSPGLTAIDFDVVGAVQDEVDALALAGAEIIILTSHLQDVTAEQALAAQLRGVDAIIAGGGDELLAPAGTVLVPGDTIAGPYPIVVSDLDGKNVPIVTTAGDYKYVGRLILGFDAAGELVAIDGASGPVRVAGGSQPDAVTPDAAVQAQVVDPLVADLAAQAANIVYTTDVGLDGIRNNIRGLETNLGDLIADAFLWVGQQRAAQFGVAAPTVALTNGGGIRNNSIIRPGPVSQLTNLGILPFANFVSVVPNVSAAQFKLLLENAVAAKPNTSGQATSGSGRYAQVAGFRMWVDLSEPFLNIDDATGTILQQGSRVRRVVLDDGTVLVDNGVVQAGAPSVSVATVDFLANGGDEYPFQGAPFTRVGITYENALREYVNTALGGNVSVLQYPGGGERRVVISNPTPVAEGQCPIDITLDTQSDSGDLSAIIQLFINQSLAVDETGDDVVDSGDLQILINAFLAGCP
jgi:5'-nucleotidase